MFHLLEVEDRMVITRVWGEVWGQDIGKCGSAISKLQLVVTESSVRLQRY